MTSWILIVLLSGFSIQGLLAYRVVCIYTNWSQYRQDIGKFVPEDVDPSLCTHLIYVYAKLKGNKLIAAEWNDEGSQWSEGMYDRVQNQKQLYPDLKTLLGVGGWMMGSKEFSRLASRPGSRRMFATTTVKFLRDRNFDGLTIDWQYPTRRGGKPYDKKNYSLLLKELRRAFDNEGKKSKSAPLMLTIGVSGSRDIIDSAYEIENITRYTDFINVMAYDLHGSWDNYTGHPSQLYARKEEFGPSTEVNVDAVMRYWISSVPDRSKLVLGTSSYGRSFTLRKKRHNGYGVPTKDPGIAGEYTKQPGMLAYYERCSQYPDATRVWDDHSKAAYWYSGDQWIAGEDVESIKAKVRWMKRFNTGGISVWSLDTDDFYDTCLNGSYPLLTAIQAEIAAPFVYTTSTWATSTEYQYTTEPTTNLPAHTNMNTFSTQKMTNEPNMNKKGAINKKDMSLKLTEKQNTLKTAEPIKPIPSKKQQKETKPTDTKDQSQRFRSRNEKPNTDKKTSKQIREGNRIIVRDAKSGQKTKTAGNEKDKSTNNKIEISKSTVPSKVTNIKTGSDKKNTKSIVEPLKMVNRSKQSNNSNSVNNIGDKKQPKQNGKKSLKKGDKAKEKGNTKRRGRKVIRKKLTKKQIQMLRRRRNKRRQLQKRKQLEKLRKMKKRN